jgi:hypothetical protein
LISQGGVNKKGKGKSPQVNLTPASYTSAASAASNTKQPTAQQKLQQKPPTITEITVIRSGTGGHMDPHIEMSIRARAADVIVQEVRLKMTNKVANPIPLRAGRWSTHHEAKATLSIHLTVTSHST